MIDQQQLANLRAKAEDAPPGPWLRGYNLHGVYAARADGVVVWVGSTDTAPTADFIAAANPATVLAMIDEVERLRAELRKAVELLTEAAPRFVSYEECMDWQDQGEDCIAKDGHWGHELRMQMDEFVERNKETK